MASSQSGSERHPVRNGKKQFGQDAPRKKVRSVNGRKTLGSLRGVALRLIAHLESSLPNNKKPLRGIAAKRAAEKDAARNQNAIGKVQWTQADYERLLGRNGGVVDSFRTLAELIVRLFEMECDPVDDTQSKFDFTESDEEDLDRRIADELDRLAERRGQANAA